MTDIIGGLLMIAGGGMLTRSGFAQFRAERPATQRARDLFGDSDGAVTRKVPTAWLALIEQLD